MRSDGDGEPRLRLIKPNIRQQQDWGMRRFFGLVGVLFVHQDRLRLGHTEAETPDEDDVMVAQDTYPQFFQR